MTEMTVSAEELRSGNPAQPQCKKRIVAVFIVLTFGRALIAQALAVVRLVELDSVGLFPDFNERSAFKPLAVLGSQ